MNNIKEVQEFLDRLKQPELDIKAIDTSRWTVEVISISELDEELLRKFDEGKEQRKP
jgi:hypothetical protein